MDNPFYKANTGVKSQNPMFNTAKYQGYRAAKGVGKMSLLAGKALFQQLIDVVKGLVGK